MKKALIILLVNVIITAIIYLVNCFIAWQILVDFGSWESYQRAAFIFLLAIILFGANAITLLFVNYEN